jgi:hypothetical protein
MRAAFAVGGALWASSCVTALCLPALLEPQPGGDDDPVAQQAAWHQTLGWLLGVGTVLLVAGYLLLAHTWLGWRVERRKRRPATEK